MEKQVFKCECGYTTHFEKALTAHCRFRHHHPATEAAEEVKKPKAEKAEKTVKKTASKKTTVRKPRTKKAETKE